MQRKKLILPGAVLLAGGLAAAVWFIQSASHQEKRKTRVGHLIALDMAPLFVAKEAGYFDEEGLDVEMEFFVDIFANNEALANGAIDFSINPFTTPYLALEKGVPIRTIASAGGWGVMQVIAQGDYQVNSIKELGVYVRAHPGEKIKVGSFRADTLDLILLEAFQAEGLTYQDFEMVWYTDLLAMVEAFKRREIGVLSHIKPYTSDLILHHGATFLTDNARVWNVHTPNCVLSVLEGLLLDEPEVVQSYLRAVLKAADLINQKPREALALLEQSSYPHYFQVGHDVVLDAIQSQPEPISFTPNITAVNAVMFAMVEHGYIKKYTPGRKLFRLEEIKKLESR